MPLFRRIRGPTCTHVGSGPGWRSELSTAPKGGKSAGEGGKSPRLSEAADSPLLQKMVKQSHTDHLLAMIDRCLEADMQIDRNVQLVLVLEALLDSLTAEPVG